MISRVADYCFWFGRYLDRAESSARLLEVTRTLVFDADIPVTHCWQPLVIVAGEEERFVAKHGRAALGNGELVQEYMTWSGENPVSLWNSVRASRECARAIRDQLSLDAWEEVNEMYLWLARESTRQLYQDNRGEFYRTVRRGTQLTLGLVRSTMLHDEPISFLWMGVMLERAGQTSRILDMHHHTMEQESQQHDIVQAALWMSLLRACSGSEAFMKKNQGRVTAQKMVEFLLFDPSFPRSLRYCLHSGFGLLQRIWDTPAPGQPGRGSLTRYQSLLTWLDKQAHDLDLANIHVLLTAVVDEVAAICSRISQDIQGPSRDNVTTAVEQVTARVPATQAQTQTQRAESTE
jgi:uncharacterized alpha-E superfamily protein